MAINLTQLLSDPNFLTNLTDLYDNYVNGDIPPSYAIDTLFDLGKAQNLDATRGKHPSNQDIKHVGGRPNLTLILGVKQ